MRTLCAILLGLLLSQSISSQDKAPDITHGNGLLQACTDEGPLADLNNAFCKGYLEGAREGLALLQKDKNTGPYFCEPEEATLGQVRDIVVKYLRDNPEHRHEVSIVLVYRALQKAWPGPCASPEK
jgi:Ssp1 endopeptidase immunity protein Rap1a